MMTSHIHNFNPGPSALPLPILHQVQRDLLDFEGSGMSLLEMSHRGAIYEKVHNKAISDLRTLLGCSEDDYAILFMGGGATTQFSLVPMNLLAPGSYGGYLVTGRWSEVALHEGRRWGHARVLWSSESTGYDRVPCSGDYAIEPNAAYLHYTSNNTIVGTQFADTPDTSDVPLVCDMTSDLLTRPLEVSRFGLIYAGAQKNLGIAGVTVVIIRRDLLERSHTGVPGLFNYSQMAAANSLLNTPPVFPVYVLGLIAAYQLAQGGLAAVADRNAEKAALLYTTIDTSNGFYHGCAQAEHRSRMNVTFRLPTPELDACFVDESVQAGFIGLKGHRAVGGIRASLYNAVSLESVRVLVAFMKDFQQRRG